MELILNAAREEFNGRGFAGATTKAIARRADVTEAQLFRYFPSKTELFHEAVFAELHRHFTEFQQQYSARGTDVDVREGAGRYIRDLQDYFADRGNLLLAVIVVQLFDPASVSDTLGIDSLSEYFEMGAAELSRRSAGEGGIDPRIMVRISFAAVLAGSVLRRWLFPKGMASDEEIDAAVRDFVIEGIGGNQAAGEESRWIRRSGDTDTGGGHRLARRFIAALSAGDLPEDLLADDMTAWTTTRNTICRTQYQLGVRLLASLFAGGLAFAIDSSTAEGGRVIVEAHARGELAGGEAYENRHVFILHITGARIASIAEHFDPDPVRLKLLPLLKAAIVNLETEQPHSAQCPERGVAEATMSPVDQTASVELGDQQ